MAQIYTRNALFQIYFTHLPYLFESNCTIEGSWREKSVIVDKFVKKALSLFEQMVSSIYLEQF